MISTDSHRPERKKEKKKEKKREKYGTNNTDEYQAMITTRSDVYTLLRRNDVTVKVIMYVG